VPKALEISLASCKILNATSASCQPLLVKQSASNFILSKVEVLDSTIIVTREP